MFMFHADTKWIWLKKQEESDEYASFVEKYQSNSGSVSLKIASEINYIAYINGKRAAFGQFPGYKDEKYYDEIDITDFSSVGENELRIVQGFTPEEQQQFFSLLERAIHNMGCTPCHHPLKDEKSE